MARGPHLIPQAVATLGMALAMAFPAASGAVPLGVQGDRLVGEDGREVVLRGANWGWWGCVEPGDASLMHAWGANLVRIAFFYSNITDPPGSDTLGGEGLALLDALCRWAQDAGLYFILDCHGPPGGCNTAQWCEGGGNRLWSDPPAQDRLEALWRELARRYRQHERLLAYELMNEPAPPSSYGEEAYRELCLRLIDALREEDSGRPVVVSGLHWGGPSGLTDTLLLPRPDIVYTFHFYAPGLITHYRGGDYRYPGQLPLGVRWLSNSPENWGLNGDTQWQLLEKSFQAPDEATEGRVMLRSTANAGTAWFDNVELLCDGEPVDVGPNTTFDTGPTGWSKERETAGEFAWDTAEGHGAPGSLRITGTDSYNAWVCGQSFRVRKGATYTLRCWAKTSAATGHTYPCVAWYASEDATVDAEWLAREMQAALDFRARHRVPVFCGEFGCSQSVPEGSGERWVRDVGTMLNRERVPWTYWNWRETTGPGSMGVWVKGPSGHYEINGRLGLILPELWAG